MYMYIYIYIPASNQLSPWRGKLEFDVASPHFTLDVPQKTRGMACMGLFSRRRGETEEYV